MMEKTIIKTTNAPDPIGPYNQAVLFGNLLFISGQVAINPATGNVENPDIIAETNLVMQNLQAILSEAGMNFSNVVKSTIFLSDMSLFTTVNEVYGKFFSDEPPARATVQAVRLPRDARVEIEAVALLRE